MQAALDDLLANGTHMLRVRGKGIGLEHDLADLREQFEVIFHLIDHKFGTASYSPATTPDDSLLNGQDLPGWLRYEKASKRFMATRVPTNALPLELVSHGLPA